MDILGNRRFVELPGSRMHELPPLLVRTAPAPKRLDRVVGMAADIVESEEILPATAFEDPRVEMEFDRRKMDLALNLVDQYRDFLSYWTWGDSILEWIRQCEWLGKRTAGKKLRWATCPSEFFVYGQRAGFGSTRDVCIHASNCRWASSRAMP